MKQWFSILILLVLTCAINSCGRHADRVSLVGIDSLIMQNPDSACELLAAYTADSLTTDDDRAYHALLTTIAHYKAYRPASSDSTINIAVNHYDHDGANPDHRMRSLLYKGCVMEELGIAMISELPASFDVKNITAMNTNSGENRLAK